MELLPIIKHLHPLNRTLAGSDTFASLVYLKYFMPSPYTIESYKAGARVWDWYAPGGYEVKSAYIEDVSSGEVVVDFADSPLHLVSYSTPIDETMTGAALLPHIHSAPVLPWKYSYYERAWGFCVDDSVTIDPERQYHVHIDAEFTKQGVDVGVGLIRGERSDEIIITSHIDHPAQSNDGLAGVASALELAERLTLDPLPAGSLSVRFVFCPETIGMIAYLAHNERLIDGMRGGLVFEMTGTDGALCMHRTKQADTVLDTIAESMTGYAREYGTHPANDERILNAPGVNVPTISLNRWPYSEYHTAGDNPDIISEAQLQDAADVAERIVRIFASDYVPVWNMRGPAMLSKHGLFVDWRTDWQRNRLIERVMLRLDGERSIYQLARDLDEDYWVVRDIVESFRNKGLVSIL